MLVGSARTDFGGPSIIAVKAVIVRQSAGLAIAPE
jgi:hypothetical protein